MIVDASAVLAVVLGEPDAPRYAEMIAAGGELRMSVANWLEAAAVVEGQADDVARDRFDRLIQAMSIELEPVTLEQAREARRAWQRFGRGHPAGLNVGDCFAYALARTRGETLLFKGDDLARTDIEPALRD